MKIIYGTIQKKALILHNQFATFFFNKILFWYYDRLEFAGLDYYNSIAKSCD